MTGSINDIYSGNALKADDIKPHGEISFVIAGAEIAKLDDGPKLRLNFQGTDKSLLLNKTNAGRIADAYGDYYAQWVGRPITLYTERVNYQGKMTDGIRVRIPQAPPQQAYAPQQQAYPPQQPGYPPQHVYASQQAHAPQQPPVQQPPSNAAPGLDDTIPF